MVENLATLREELIEIQHRLLMSRNALARELCVEIKTLRNILAAPSPRKWSFNTILKVKNFIKKHKRKHDVVN